MQDELARYLSTVPEDMKNEDVLKWWFERQHIYSNLSRMTLDYYTILCKFSFYSQMHILQLFETVGLGEVHILPAFQPRSRSQWRAL